MATAAPARPSVISHSDRAEQQLLAAIERGLALGEASLLPHLTDGLSTLSRDGVLDGLKFPRVCAEHYARRLVHADPLGRFMVIAMTWGPGQYTALHDHAGLWCVEAVAAGEMEIIRYELRDEDASGKCRFARRESVAARKGSSGGLIPPFEHHVFGNKGRQPAHTLHVYGGEMDHCFIFETAGDGKWQRVRRELKFDE